MSRGRMIFHAPYVVGSSGTSASRVRPHKMLLAFRSEGWDVFDLSGSPAERRERFRELRRLIGLGECFDFLYSESSTQPNSLAMSVKSGFAPLLEPRIFRFVRKSGISCGVFYRDIHWRFPSLRGEGSPIWRSVIQFLQRFDLLVYRLLGVKLFVPSLEMVKYLPPYSPKNALALPPGMDEFGDSRVSESGELAIGYVGAIGPNYRIQSLLEAVSGVEGITLDVSLPSDVWNSVSDEYSALMGPNVRLQHLRHDELGTLYAGTQIGAIVVEPSEYWKFAVPAKLFEYIGWGMGIIVSSGTLAARLVDEMGVGWVVESEVAEIRKLLEYLRDHPEEVERVRQVSMSLRADHTWASRARAVVKELAPGKSMDRDYSDCA